MQPFLHSDLRISIDNKYWQTGMVLPLFSYWRSLQFKDSNFI